MAIIKNISLNYELKIFLKFKEAKAKLEKELNIPMKWETYFMFLLGEKGGHKNDRR